MKKTGHFFPISGYPLLFQVSFVHIFFAGPAITFICFFIVNITTVSVARCTESMSYATITNACKKRYHILIKQKLLK